jgi:hypothetical protein
MKRGPKVLEEFSDVGDCVVTVVPSGVGNACWVHCIDHENEPNSILVSVAQARRLIRGLQKFVDEGEK